jgi:hypothetical protein
MSQQEQQIKLEDDNSSITDDDFVRLEDHQTTPNNEAVQQQQPQNGTNLSFEPPSSMEMDELKLKVTALEVFVLAIRE